MDNLKRSLLNGLVSSSLDRISIRRSDDVWIAAKLAESGSKFLPIWKLKSLFSNGDIPLPIVVAGEMANELLKMAETVVLLGEENGETYFALGFNQDESQMPLGLKELGIFQDLRAVGPIIDRGHGAILSYARAMLHWHSRHRFCGDCGSPTASRQGGHLRVCTNELCGQSHFPRTDPAIIVLVHCGTHCLLGRQPIWPKGRYSTIAGFVEPGETIENAVSREVFEETGVKLSEIHYHSSQPWPFPGSIMLGFTATAGSNGIHLNDNELEDARWFSRDEIRNGLESGILLMPPDFTISFRLIEDWFNSEGPLKFAELIRKGK